jgi:hypothetical protein
MRQSDPAKHAKAERLPPLHLGSNPPRCISRLDFADWLPLIRKRPTWHLFALRGNDRNQLLSLEPVKSPDVKGSYGSSRLPMSASYSRPLLTKGPWESNQGCCCFLRMPAGRRVWPLGAGPARGAGLPFQRRVFSPLPASVAVSRHLGRRISPVATRNTILSRQSDCSVSVSF